ncbi:carboxymuconolactone decarboxylase family protein [Pseudoduganella ginsengisoli]|uniref:Carboxymuconolactone decarboxylase family protein n=1 Tax=Pseudoduganella ginsengisoli TaxID=1462440 RepID=A0A6L6Q5M9_9BURK|nr:carboxymuconolactone decarboxylase family protein [Pseudoduganella ginsengisoli]MTW04442.1 carboxymuconolactone decarboxylase family protein [Pseudoduganella ginsengisoli]
MSLTARLNYFQLAQPSFNALLALSETIQKSSLGVRLVDLVLLRVSQINGCGYCIDLHWRDLVRNGADPRHLNAVAGWREAPFFSDRERAALHWAELVAQIPRTDPDDASFAELRKHFTDGEIAELGFTIATITAWNLLNVSFRNPIPAKG